MQGSLTHPKTFEVTLPFETAQKLEAVARYENRTISELLEDSLKAYLSTALDKFFEETLQYAATRNPEGYTEEDIPRLVKEVRAEIAREALDQKAS